MNNFRRRLLSRSWYLSLALLLFSCKGGENVQQNTAPQLEVSIVKEGNGTVSKEYPASIEGVADVEIRPQVSGYLQQILVNEGAYVHAGQPLFKIEDRIYAEQYNTAKAGVLVARANLKTAKIDLDRRKELVKEKIVSDLQFQQADATHQAAIANLSQAEASAQAARINYDFCIIKAPVSGYLSRINYRLGSLIGPTGIQPITILSDIHKVNVYFSMSEPDFLNFQEINIGSTVAEKVKNAALVDLQIADGKIYENKGKIDAVEGQFNSNTGSITFRASFENPKTILRAGNTGKILIKQNFDNVVLVPIASTTTVQDKIYVFSLDKENKAVQKSIEIAGKSGTDYMVTDGIKSGDRYIISGFERLQPGMPVIPKSADDKKAAQKNTVAAKQKG